MNCILAVRQGIKIKFRSQEFAAVHVQGVWQATNKESEVFSYLRQNVPKINEINMKDVIFFGLRNKQQFEDHNFGTKSNATERRAWGAFTNVCRNFIGNERAE
jgi:hypothetical protein